MRAAAPFDGMFVKKSAITSGGEGLIKGFSWYAYPAGRVCSHLRWGESYNRLNQHGSPPGRSFYSCKRNQNTLGALPQDPDAPERPPGKPKGGFPERGLNGAYKVPQRICPLPASPASGEGNALPFPANRQPR